MGLVSPLTLSLSLFSSRCKKDEKMVNQFWKQKLKSCIIVVIVQVDVDVAIVSVALCGTPLQVKRHSVIFQLLFLRWATQRQTVPNNNNNNSNLELLIKQRHHAVFLKKWAVPASFSLFLSFKSLPMAVFEPRTTGVRNDPSAKPCPTTTTSHHRALNQTNRC